MPGSKRLSPAQRADRAALARRLKGARLQTAVRLQREITQDEMAELMGRRLGRPFHATQWRRYEAGKSEPPLEVIRAVAHISGLPECQLAFGTADQAVEVNAGPLPPEIDVERFQPEPRRRGKKGKARA